MEYFFKHKLILSGYDFSFKDGPFDSIIIDYLKKIEHNFLSIRPNLYEYRFMPVNWAIQM